MSTLRLGQADFVCLARYAYRCQPERLDEIVRAVVRLDRSNAGAYRFRYECSTARPLSLAAARAACTADGDTFGSFAEASRFMESLRYNLDDYTEGNVHADPEEVAATLNALECISAMILRDQAQKRLDNPDSFE